MNETLQQLSKPFHPSHITWKPGAFNRDKTKALALAYADVRAYQNRLDEVCGMDWSVTYSAWGERIICHLTINGVVRSSTGEPDSQSERSEIAGTATEAQAFKRACSMFGLGRYLYNLPTVWAELDAGGKQFSEQGKARLQGIVTAHYRRQVGDKSTKLADLSPLCAELEQLGSEIYGEQWPQVRRHNVERISNGATEDCSALDEESVQKLITGLRKLKHARQPA